MRSQNHNAIFSNCTTMWRQKRHCNLRRQQHGVVDHDDHVKVLQKCAARASSSHETLRVRYSRTHGCLCTWYHQSSYAGDRDDCVKDVLRMCHEVWNGWASTSIRFTPPLFIDTLAHLSCTFLTCVPPQTVFAIADQGKQRWPGAHVRKYKRRNEQNDAPKRRCCVNFFLLRCANTFLLPLIRLSFLLYRF